MRAVQCGHFAVGAHTSLTEPDERKRTQQKRAVDACQGLKATRGWQLTISSENPSDLALRVSVEEEMTSTPVAA